MSIFFSFVKKNIRRTPYQAFAATMVMFFTFFCLSTFLIVAVGSQQILKYYESKPQAIAFFKDGTNPADVQRIEDVLNQTGKIKSLHYVSKNEALQIYRQNNKNNPLLLELVTASILPASLEISTVSPDDLQPIANLVQKEPTVEEVVFPADVVSSLTQATRIIRIIGGSVVGFLAVFSTLVIVMIIGFKIRIKRAEIETMKLLGAPVWFIRIPYLLEGIIYSLTGAILGWAFSFAILWYVSPLLLNGLGEVSSQVWPPSILFITGLLAAQVIAALLVGGLGSFTALRRYLKI